MDLEDSLTTATELFGLGLEVGASVYGTAVDTAVSPEVEGVCWCYSDLRASTGCKLAARLAG